MMRIRSAPLLAAVLCCLSGQASAYLFDPPPWLQSVTSPSTPPPPPAVTVTAPSTSTSVLSCLPSPGDPSKGYWRYHVERGSGRHCWYPTTSPLRNPEPKQRVVARVAEDLNDPPNIRAPERIYIPPPWPTTPPTYPQLTVVEKTSTIVQNTEHTLPPPSVVNGLAPIRVTKTPTWMVIAMVLLIQVGIFLLLMQMFGKPKRRSPAWT